MRHVSPLNPSGISSSPVRVAISPGGTRPSGHGGTSSAHSGAGHRARTARVDLTRIPDPEAWLTNRLGPLASFEMRSIAGSGSDAPDPAAAVRLDTLASRLTASMQAVLAARRAALEALSARLDAAKPAALRRTHHPQPEEETEA